MTDRRDIRSEMRKLLLDRDTADRLLTGHVEPDDAPPGYAHVAELLRSASSCPPVDAEREHATVAAMVEELRSHLEDQPPVRQRRPVTRFGRAKVLAIAVGAMLVGTTSLAFAGALPGAAQGVAKSMLATIGITVPGPNPHATTHPSRVPATPLITPPSLRVGVRRLVEPIMPRLPIISLGELPAQTPIHSLATWELPRAA